MSVRHHILDTSIVDNVVFLQSVKVFTSSNYAIHLSNLNTKLNKKFFLKNVRVILVAWGKNMVTKTALRTYEIFGGTFER